MTLYRSGKPIGKTKLPAGREVHIIAEEGSGYRISPFSGCEGIAPKASVRVKEAEQPTPAATPETSTVSSNSEKQEKQPDVASNANESVVQPGKTVFLRLPFRDDDQTCKNANTVCILKVLEFLGSDATPSEEEFDELMGSKAKEPSKATEAAAVRQLGYSMEILAYEDDKGQISKDAAEKMESDVMQSLDKGSPLTATKDKIYEALSKGLDPDISKDNRKTFVLVGYDMPTKTFYAWRPEKSPSQRSIGNRISDAPQGLFEIPVGSLAKTLTYLHYFQKPDTGSTGQAPKVPASSKDGSTESGDGLTRVVGPSGGEIRSEDPSNPLYGVTIHFPKDCISQNTKIAMSVLPKKQRVKIGAGEDSGVWAKVSAEGLEAFNPPAEVKIRYDVTGKRHKGAVPYLVSNKSYTHATETQFNPDKGEVAFLLAGPTAFTWTYVPIIKKGH